MDDGVDLGRLIDETRKLAAENAQFCEIHTNLNREIKRLKDEKLNLNQQNGSLSKKVKHLQAKLDGGEDIVSQLKVCLFFPCLDRFQTEKTGLIIVKYGEPEIFS